MFAVRTVLSSATLSVSRAGCGAPDPARDTPDAPRRPVSHVREQPPPDAASGLKVSRGHLLQDRDVQRLLSHKTLQPSVFLLQRFETTCLANLHTTVFLAPPVVGLFTDTKLTDNLEDCLALRGPDLCLTKLSNDLLCGVTFPGHMAPFLCPSS